MDHLRLFPSNLSLLAARPARGTDNAVLLRSVELSGAEAHVHSPSQLPEAGLGYADLPQGQDYGARALDRQSTSKIQLCAHLPVSSMMRERESNTRLCMARDMFSFRTPARLNKEFSSILHIYSPGSNSLQAHLRRATSHSAVFLAARTPPSLASGG